MASVLWSVLLELSPWLLLGALVAGVLHVTVPQRWLRQHLTGRWGVLKAVLLGVPLPLCSCGVIPVGLGLRKDGASSGASVGFLIATPQTGVDSILVSGSFLGWPFALFKVIAALITGLVGGTITDNVTSNDAETTGVLSDQQQVTPGSNRLKIVLTHAYMLIASVWRWLIFGIVVSSLITWLVPEDSLTTVPGMTGITAMLLTLLISVPLYVCATASVPIAAALVASGLPPGAAMVFLMAGPATNVATMGAVYRGLGLRPLIVYLTTIIAGSIAAGFVFDSVVQVPELTMLQHEHGTEWWSTVSAIVLLLVLAKCAVDDVITWQRRRHANAITDQQDVQLRRFQIQGMSCTGCANTVERVLANIDGIESAEVSFEQKQATVSGRIDNGRIIDAIKGAGFEATEASEAAHETSATAPPTTI